VDLDPEAGD
jgi:nucleosome assembly protein 1-like 1